MSFETENSVVILAIGIYAHSFSLKEHTIVQGGVQAPPSKMEGIIMRGNEEVVFMRLERGFDGAGCSVEKLLIIFRHGADGAVRATVP